MFWGCIELPQYRQSKEDAFSQSWAGWLTSENQARISHYRTRTEQMKNSFILAKWGGEYNSERRQGRFVGFFKS